MLLLPLLGGYIFVRFFNYTKIHILRSDKDRLLIRASIVGLFALVIAYAARLFFHWMFPCGNYNFCFSQWWQFNVPFEYSDVSIIAFLIGALGWIPLNRFFDEDGEIDRAIREDANPFELLLKRAQDENVQVLLSMTNHKVYVGYIIHQFNPASPTNYIGLLPMQSGYRDSTTKELFFTINYTNVYEMITGEIDDIAHRIEKIENMSPEEQAKLVESGQPDYWELTQEWERLEDTTDLFELVIPTNQIASINFYDDEIHAKYFQPSPLTEKVE